MKLRKMMFNFLNQRHYAKFHHQGPPKRHYLWRPQQRKELRQMERSGIHPYQKNNNDALVNPQKEPFTNTFVIICPDEKDAETVYRLAYNLWKSNLWHQLFIGPVIPFLRINDFKKDFDYKVNEMLQEHELHQKQVQTFRLLKQKEDQLHKNIVLINEMRRAILHSSCRK